MDPLRYAANVDLLLSNSTASVGGWENSLGRMLDEDGDPVLSRGRPRRRLASSTDRAPSSVHGEPDALLADLLLHGEELHSADTIVELACRSPLVALTAAEGGARLVIATATTDSALEAAAVAESLASNVRVRTLDPVELPRLLRAIPEHDGADAALAGRFEWTAADLDALQRVRVLIAGHSLLALINSAPQDGAGARADAAVQAAALVEACRVWLKGGDAAVAAELEARILLSGQDASERPHRGADSDTREAALVEALVDVLSLETAGNCGSCGEARILLLSVSVHAETAEDGTGKDADHLAGGGNGGTGKDADQVAGGGNEHLPASSFRWRVDAPPHHLAAKLRRFIAAGLELRWAPASAIPSRLRPDVVDWCDSSRVALVGANGHRGSVHAHGSGMHAPIAMTHYVVRMAACELKK